MLSQPGRYWKWRQIMEQMTALGKKRVIVISNRLPFVVKNDNGDFRYIPSVGGLATGLQTCLEYLQNHFPDFEDYVWVGWPGIVTPEHRKEEVQAKSLDEFNAVPVFLSEEEVEGYYHGFCNDTIWPLFHYFQVYTNYSDACWARYVDVNRSFCRALVDIVRPDDILWIHDYHLMLLPAMIREHIPSASIGFFLHIPFPNLEIFRLLPSEWRREILRGMLGADLIGFHTNDYRQDFLRCVIRILGHEANMGEMIVGDRLVKAETFPMGIDYKKYHDQAADPLIQRGKTALLKHLGNVKIILSIDRLDYTKGIANRLEAFQTFLETYPEWFGKAVLVLIVAPSRVDVEQYVMMKHQIEALVGNINGRFGRPDWTPIVYMFRALTFGPLVEMYASSHVALITPLRDGMNLIAKEYIATRVDKTGVLILSEMTGASKELLEAVIVNPNNRNEIADALFEALTMPEEEQVRRNTIMQQRLQRYTVVRWATDFIEELQTEKKSSQNFLLKVLSPHGCRRIVEHFHRCSRRLLLLDYDGTLVPFSTLPQDALPDPTLLKILGDLCEIPGNEVVIVSGRDKNFLERLFADLKINLIAEHGAWIKEWGCDWQVMANNANEWKPKLKPLFERYVDRVAGSFVEEKDFALVWHYRGAEPEPGKLASQELKDNLLAFTANIDVRIVQGNKTVEARVAEVNKGAGGLRFLNRFTYDFILCIGDDTTDEDLFCVLPETAYSIRVGLSGTCARHTVSGVDEVIQLLGQIAAPRIDMPIAAQKKNW
jgi:trehalose 6-phosphate synthase/phosphatase